MIHLKQGATRTPTLAIKSDSDYKFESKLMVDTEEKAQRKAMKPDSSAAIINLTTAGHSDF